MERYAYLIAAVGLGIVGLGVVYLYQRHRSQAGAKQTWLSYLLIWPLILDADKSKRDGRFLTKREWLGWGLVLLLIALAILFTAPRGGG
jgi:hypothetical protein